MLNFSPEKLFVIGMLALIVLGPNRLPVAARNLGKAVAHLRRLSGSLQTEMHEVLAEPRQVLQSAVEEFGVGNAGASIRSAVLGSAVAPSSPSAPLNSAGEQTASTPPAASSATSSAPAGPRPSSFPQGAAGSTVGAVTPVPDDPSFN